jgi:hypothetical protein
MAFSVGPPTLSYQMTVNLALPKPDGTFDIESMNIGSEVSRSVSAKQQATVEVIGDFVPLQQPKTFENKVLFVQRSNVNDPSCQLLIEREGVSFDGSECNKVGVGYTAFNQAQ